MDLIYMQMKAIKRENTRWKSKKRRVREKEKKEGEDGRQEGDWVRFRLRAGNVVITVLYNILT